jgi:hypothetical protein
MSDSWYHIMTCGRCLAFCGGDFVLAQCTALLGIFNFGIEMYCWSNEVNVLLDIFRQAVLFAGNVSLASTFMRVLKVLSV